jgi:FkbH-like protein
MSTSLAVRIDRVDPLASLRQAVRVGDVSGAVDSVRRVVNGPLACSARLINAGRLAMELARASKTAEGTYPRLRIAILGGYATDMIAPAIAGGFLAEGRLVDIYEGPFNAFRQEILDPDSGFHAFEADVLLIAVGRRNLNCPPAEPSSGKEGTPAGAEAARWQELWRAAAGQRPLVILQHLFELPANNLQGVAERASPRSERRFVGDVNAALIEARVGQVGLIDVDSLAAMVGRSRWESQRLYYHAKMGWDPTYLPQYLAATMAAWRSAVGLTKKTLVVDLDNTLWGGVLGDDGVEGIRLGLGTAEGEAYAALWRYLAELRRRGVILAICSKNEPAIVGRAFAEHPHLSLTLGDFAAVACSWDDKATSLRRIAGDLNVDLSSLVFADDNPFECEWVRRVLPEVEVVHLAGDPADAVGLIDRRHLFDAQVSSDAANQRIASYQARRSAEALRLESGSIADYLVSLEMIGTIAEASQRDLSRLAEMQLRTNQFNLTSLRLSREQLATLLAVPDHAVLAVTLQDRFADHGIVSSVVMEHDADRLRIKDWLMSCRVFSRTLEECILNHVRRYATQHEIATIVGEYHPNGKNGVVSNLYGRLGFEPCEVDETGRWWQLDIRTVRPLTTFVRIDDAGAPFAIGRPQLHRSAYPSTTQAWASGELASDGRGMVTV